MNKGSEHKAFDKQLKERCGSHELTPPADLWDKVNAGLAKAEAEASEFDEVHQDLLRGHESTVPEALGSMVNHPQTTTKANFFLKHRAILSGLGILFMIAIVGMVQHWRNVPFDVEQPIEIPSEADNDAETGSASSIPTYPREKAENDRAARNTEMSNSAKDAEDALKTDVAELVSQKDNNIPMAKDVAAFEKAINESAETSQEIAQPTFALPDKDSTRRNELTTDESSDTPNGDVVQAPFDSAHNDDSDIDVTNFGHHAAAAPDSREKQEIDIPTAVGGVDSSGGTTGTQEPMTWSREVQDKQGEVESNQHADMANEVSVYPPATESDSIPGLDVLNSNEPTSGANERVWSVVALCAPAFSHRTLLSNLSQSRYGDVYDNQKSRLHFAGSLSASYQFDENWSINFGLGYSQLSQKLELPSISVDAFPNVLVDGSSESITVYSSLNTVSSENVDFSEFMSPGGDPDNPDDYSLISFREEQEFGFLSIPLTVRYTRGSQKIKWLADAGLSATLVVRDRSQIEVGSRDQLEAVVRFDDYHDVNTFGLRFTGGFGVWYGLRNGTSLLFLPNWSHSLGNLNRTQEWVIRPWSIGLALGVQHRL